MRIAICDTDVGALEETKGVLGRYLRERNREAEIAVFASAKELLARRKGGERYDIYLFEVMLQKMDGIDLGFEIRETQPDAPIVYVTRSLEGANATFSVSTIGYVLKPCVYDVFAVTLDRAYGRLAVTRQ